LCSPAATKVVFQTFQQRSDVDLVSTVGLPLGMNSSGYTVDYLRRCLKDRKTGKYETGWGRVFKSPRELKVKVSNHDLHGPLRFTLDYPDDARFFATVIEYLKEDVLTVPDEKLIEVVKEQKFDSINSHLYKIYWENYNTLKEKESNDEQII